MPQEARQTLKICAEWESKRDKTKARIKTLERQLRASNKKLEDDTELQGLCQDRDVDELEIEGWSLAVAKQDSSLVRDFLDEQLNEIKTKITASQKGGSVTSDTTTTKT